MTHTLSKSSYVKGCQCPKALWLHKHRRDLIPPVSPAQQAVFDTGHAVGMLARQLFPGGVDLSPASARDFSQSIEATRRAVADGVPVIYEAAFVHDGVLAALDILVRDGDGWKAYEVKSSTNVKDYHLTDAALQSWVIEGCGLSLADVSIVHINNQYVRQGAVDVQRLFTIASVKERMAAERMAVPQRVAGLKDTLQLPHAPETDIGPHCRSPFQCDLMHHCWAHVPEGSVFDLAYARGREWDLYRRGIVRLADIPEDEPLTTTQQRQVRAFKHGESQVDKIALRTWLAELRYPLHHLDFETFNPAIPPFDRTRPYQQLPFQYSIHVQHARGATPEHREHLADGHGDPRAELVRRLLDDIGPDGDILAYNAGFERMVLQDLSLVFPEHAPALQGIIGRIKDLRSPFQWGWYVVPAMNGRTSIKVVLPALVPSLGYADLEIQEGGTASGLFQQLVEGRYAGDQARLRQDLLAYCGRDTYAMVKVLEVLEQAVG
ncbi:MAG: DUF2779 domain-containing protein [Flavobacteriales bacterium]|nr:DUF2779 domain-containing protein [Flavobacteriales bacterium]